MLREALVTPDNPTPTVGTVAGRYANRFSQVTASRQVGPVCDVVLALLFLFFVIVVVVVVVVVVDTQHYCVLSRKHSWGSGITT